MRYWFSYFLTVLLGGILFSLAYYVLAPLSNARMSYVSPLPDSLTLGKNNQVTLLDLWTPIIETFADANGQPLVGASQALLYELDTNKTMYEKNSTLRVPMASLTKIMTAIVALDDPNMPHEYTVSAADLVGEDSMGLSVGETLSKEELLYGLMLNSGNDAAEVIAHNYPGGRHSFLKAMSNKAAALDLTNTKFSNPSGLQGDGEQYTTAQDLLIMTRYALDTFPIFRTIVSTYHYDIPATSHHKDYYLTNETNLLSTYPGVKGVKTGYTPEAGLCLVTYYEKDGIRFIGIVLNSPNRRGDMRDLLDFGLKEHGITPPKID